jgi:hypothetical protein
VGGTFLTLILTRVLTLTLILALLTLLTLIRTGTLPVTLNPTIILTLTWQVRNTMLEKKGNPNRVDEAFMSRCWKIRVILTDHLNMNNA